MGCATVKEKLESKIMLLSQQKAIKNSFLKFSNTVLFENRERNLSSRKDLNPKKQKKI